MTNQLPPDRDDNLRNAFSLSPDDQVRLLQRLVGESETLPKKTALSSPTKQRHGFTHYGGITKTGPRGAFVYVPIPIPPVIADADTRTLTLTVDHGRLDRREQPRVPATINKLKTLSETALPFRGTHTLTIQTPPRRWTAAHLEWLVREMAQFLPPIHRPGQPIGFTLFGVNCDALELRVSRATDLYGFRVRCELSPVALRPALDSWQYVTNGTSVILGNEPLAPLPEPRDPGNEPMESDDDLDAIEKTARLTLHGGRTTPSKRKSNAWTHPIIAKLERIDALSPPEILRMLDEMVNRCLDVCERQQWEG